MKITPQTWKIVGALTVAISVPLTNILVRRFGVEVGPEVKDYLDIVSAITVLGGGGYAVSLTTPAAQVEAVKSLAAEDQAAALSKVSDVAKVQIAKAVPGVATVVLENNVTNGLAKLAKSDAPENKDIVTAQQNQTDVLKGVRAI